MTATRSTTFLQLVVFLAGIGTLGIEMVMPRLLAPFFGTSQPIWAVVIGMTLLYLALGYRLGGSLADRHPDERVLYRLIAIAGLSCAFIPLIARPILGVAQQSLQNIAAGGFVAALLGVVLLFALPVTLLAMVGPFVVRLQIIRMQEGVAAAGRTVGSISALSTIGSIAGTFLTVLLLIPTLGTEITIYLFAVFLIALAVFGLRDWRYLLLLLPVLALVLFTSSGRQAIKSADCYRCSLVAEDESQYNYIQVAYQDFAYADGVPDPRMILVLNEGRARHSVYRLRYAETGDPVDLLTDGGPWDYFSIAPYVYPQRHPDSVQSMLMLGSAAGTVPKQFLAIYGPETRIDAVELDPRIIEMGRQYFAMEDQDPAFPNYRVHAADARYWLATSADSYDVIAMDAYHQPYIPFHLTTSEFFAEVRAHLNPTGVAVVNAGRSPGGDDRLVNAIAGTMRQVFPQVFIIDTRLPSSNGIIIGVNQPVGDGVANFQQNAAQMDIPALQVVMYWALVEGAGPVREFSPAEARFAPFTDDRAPVEQLIDGMMFGTVTELRRP